MSERAQIISDGEMINMLQERVVSINHLTLAGEERERRVTLAPDLIPVEKRPKSARAAPEGMLRVFDVDLQEWRTIIIDTVIVLD